MQFVDRFLKCSDCGNDFVFTAGEQLFFHDKQFKNDPKRCKLCKAKRAGLGRSGSATSPTALPLSRTETRTECSACGIETTVPFKPTQGRPVLCRSCFQMKRVPSGVAAVATMDTPGGLVAAAEAALDEAMAKSAAESGQDSATIAVETPVEPMVEAAVASASEAEAAPVALEAPQA
ncbi:MAG: zinc-ribbon domain containing protein [Acidobacteriota bacterium]